MNRRRWRTLFDSAPHSAKRVDESDGSARKVAVHAAETTNARSGLDRSGRSLGEIAFAKLIQSPAISAGAAGTSGVTAVPRRLRRTTTGVRSGCDFQQSVTTSVAAQRAASNPLCSAQPSEHRIIDPAVPQGT